VLAFGFTRENAVTDEMVAYAQTLADLAGSAIGRASRYEREHDAAHQLQQSLLPVIDPDLPGVRASTLYRPADLLHDVGGDWFDVFALPGGRVGFAVGDVVGHDLRAATAMGKLQSAVRYLAHLATGPADLLTRLDQASAHIPDTAMTTVGYGVYDPATGDLRYACAGHPPPLLADDTGVHFLWEGRSTPLGVTVDGSPERPEGRHHVDAGATLVWYSDGLIERRADDLHVGLDRLAAAVADLAPDAHPDWCEQMMTTLTAGDVLQDDAVILCLRLLAPRRTDGRG
jgi:serine phosphatase RsbU (regulator of sigma subunit)